MSRGTRGDDLGRGFLADVSKAWEAATQPAADAGIRVVNLRIGIVLSPEGGALGNMLPIFRAGLGGRVGRGEQWWSWISREDLIRVIYHAILQDAVVGPINAVSPHPVKNSYFTQTLAEVLHRPAILPAPAGPLRMVLGDVADEMLLASQNVAADKLLATGFTFRHPQHRAMPATNPRGSWSTRRGRRRCQRSGRVSELVLLVHAAATWFMLGLIWFVQLTHYPLFDRVQAERFAEFSETAPAADHAGRRRTDVGGISDSPGVALVSPRRGCRRLRLWRACCWSRGLWVSTAAWQVPAHQKLSQGFDPAVHRRLVLTNWLRTGLWSVRGGLVFYMLMAAH